MACHYCRHYQPPPYKDCPKGVGIVASVREEVGVCTLSPTWQKVTGLHYCAQYSPTDAALPGHFWVQMHEGTIAREAIRTKCRELEKKLKALRTKFRKGRE